MLRAIDTLRTQLEAARTSTDVANALHDLAALLASPSTSDSSISRATPSILSLLFGPLLRGWVPALPSHALDVFFFPDAALPGSSWSPPLLPLLDLVIGLSTSVQHIDLSVSTSSTTLSTFQKSSSLLLRVLHRFFASSAAQPGDDIFAAIAQSLAAPDTPQPVADAVVVALTTLPDRLANAFRGRRVPSEWRAERFFRRMLASVLHVCAAGGGGGRGGGGGALGVLLSKCVRLGHGGMVADLLVERVVDGAGVGVRDVVLGLASDARETFLVRLLRVVVEAEYALEKRRMVLPFLFAESLGEEETADRQWVMLLTHKLLLVRSLPRGAVNALLQLLEASRPQLVDELLTEAATLWSEARYVKHATDVQHRQVTSVIIGCMMLLQQRQDGTATFHDHASFGSLMSGVQLRLAHTVQDTRVLGMLVAEEFSKLIDPAQPLLFDELDDAMRRNGLAVLEDAVYPLVVSESAAEPEPEPAREDPEPEPETSSQRVLKTNKTSRLSLALRDAAAAVPAQPAAPAMTLDADEEWTRLAESDESESDEESDSSLEAFDLTDDRSDLRKVKLPVTLRQLLAYIHKGVEKHADHVEAALEASESLVRRVPAPSDLHHIAPSLLKALLNLQTAVHTLCESEKFDALRHSATVALTVVSPVQAADILVAEFYSDNCTIAQRMGVLEVIHESAWELSSLRPPARTLEAAMSQLAGMEAEEEQQPVKLERDDDAPLTREDHERIIRERVERKTRRWGNAKKRAKSGHTGVNEFAPVALRFFFPLVAHVDKPVRGLDMFGDQHDVLARLLYVLGVIVYCAGSAASTVEVGTMCKALFKLVFAVRFHSQAGVRRSSVFAVSRLVEVIPASLMTSEFGDEFDELMQWLQAVMADDPDEQTRFLSYGALMVMQEAMRTHRERLEKEAEREATRFQVPTAGAGEMESALSHGLDSLRLHTVRLLNEEN